MLMLYWVDLYPSNDLTRGGRIVQETMWEDTNNTFLTKFSKALVNNQLNYKPAKKDTPNNYYTQLSEI